MIAGMGNHLESYKKLIGKKIQKRRIEKAFSNQQALADKLGVDQSQITKWETGVHMPEGRHRKSLGELLDVPDDFFEMIEVTPPVSTRSDVILSIISDLSALDMNQLEDIQDALEHIKNPLDLDLEDEQNVPKRKT